MKHHHIVLVPLRGQRLERGRRGTCHAVFECLAGTRVVEGLGDNFLAIDIDEILPERVPRVGGIHRRKLLQTLVTACENAIFDVRLNIAVPMFTEIGGQPAVVPRRDIHQVVVGDVGADRRALHHPMGIDIHDAGANHLVQMGAVAVEVDVYLGTVNVGHTALVVEIRVIIGEVRLAKVRLRVIDDDLQLLFGGVIQQFFNLLHNFGRFVEDVLRQRTAGGIVIDVILFRPKVLPVEVLVLHAVLPEGELRAVVELGMGGQ